MDGDENPLKIVFIIALIVFAFIGGLIFLDFLVHPQTGNIAGFPITMPGVAWVGVPIVLVIVLILYVKSRM